MYSKVKIFGHPIHPMLIAFPVALYTATLVSYIVYDSNSNIFWFRVAVVANIAGVIMAVIAAIPGLIDWLYIPRESRAKQTGVYHLMCNVLALCCFAISAWVNNNQWNEERPETTTGITLSAVGFILTLLAGLLGWKLVQKHHVGVDEDYPATSTPKTSNIT
jgi:uncharacterized membrane protein